MAQEYRNSLEDLFDIGNKGINRPIPSEKSTSHYGDFSALIRLLEHLKLNGDIYNRGSSLEQFYPQSEKLLEQIKRELSANSAPRELLDNAFDYLAEQDLPQTADVIFVFGGMNLIRPDKAAELYLKGLAPLVYCSGSRPIEDAGREHEGRRYRDHILEKYQIDPDKVIADPNDNSLSMVENVKGFLNYLDENKLPARRILMVTADHNLRRGQVIFLKHMAGGEIIRCGCGQVPGVMKDDWYQKPLGIKLIYEEYEKIKIQQLFNSS